MAYQIGSYVKLQYAYTAGRCAWLVCLPKISVMSRLLVPDFGRAPVHDGRMATSAAWHVGVAEKALVHCSQSAIHGFSNGFFPCIDSTVDLESWILARPPHHGCFRRTHEFGQIYALKLPCHVKAPKAIISIAHFIQQGLCYHDGFPFGMAFVQVPQNLHS